MTHIPIAEHDEAMKFARQRIAELQVQLEAQQRMYENRIRSMVIMQRFQMRQTED